MKNKYLLMFVTMIIIILFSTCAYAENSTNEIDYSGNTDNENLIELDTYEKDNEVKSLDSSDSNIVNFDSNEYIQIDNYSMDWYNFQVTGHTLKDLGSDHILYKYYDMELYGETEKTTDIKDGNFSFSIYNDHNVIYIYSGNNKYLATMSYDFDTSSKSFNSINFTYEPYQKNTYINSDGTSIDNFLINDGSYFNYIMDNLEELSDKTNITIRIKDNIILNEPFTWNKTNINLTIVGNNGTRYVWEHDYAYNPFYKLSVPSIYVGEKSNLRLSSINLVSNRTEDSSFIVNDGELILSEVLITDKNIQPSLMEESFLIINNAKMDLINLNTANYSSNTSKQKLLFNKGKVTCYNDRWVDDKDYYGYDFDVDTQNYYIYNEGQITHLHNCLENTVIESNSDYDYDVIYKDFEYGYINVFGKNVLIDNCELDMESTINAEEIKLQNCWYQMYKFKEFDFNVTDITIINCTFTNPVFTNNTIKAENIILDNNTFEFNKNFEKIHEKIEDYNKVKLIYNNLTYTNNTLKNFEFIMSDIQSNDTNQTIDYTTPNNEKVNTTSNNENVNTTSNNEKVKSSLKVNNIPKKVVSFNSHKLKYNYDIITLSHNEKITLSWLNNIFNNNFNNDTLLIYLNGKLVFNGSVGEELYKELFNIPGNYHGIYTLKVITSNGDVYTKQINIK